MTSRGTNEDYGSLNVVSLDPDDITRVLATCSLCGNTGSYDPHELVAGSARTCGRVRCQTAFRAGRVPGRTAETGSVKD
jgi:hypothetical protein